jgi:hypothetical protein
MNDEAAVTAEVEEKIVVEKALFEKSRAASAPSSDEFESLADGLASDEVQEPAYLLINGNVLSTATIGKLDDSSIPNPESGKSS